MRRFPRLPYEPNKEENLCLKPRDIKGERRREGDHVKILREEKRLMWIGPE